MTASHNIHDLLAFYTLGRAEIATLCQTSINEVNMALDPACCTQLPHSRLMQIRSIIEQQLYILGWESVGIDIWEDFDQAESRSSSSVENTGH